MSSSWTSDPEESSYEKSSIIKIPGPEASLTQLDLGGRQPLVSVTDNTACSVSALNKSQLATSILIFWEWVALCLSTDLTVWSCWRLSVLTAKKISKLQVAIKLHAHSGKHAHQVVTTYRRALKNLCHCSSSRSGMGHSLSLSYFCMNTQSSEGALWKEKKWKERLRRLWSTPYINKGKRVTQ